MLLAIRNRVAKYVNNMKYHLPIYLFIFLVPSYEELYICQHNIHGSHRRVAMLSIINL
jgi:hypothetical protein